MSEHLAHKAAWWPRRVRIAGLRLAPVTLGQLRLLEAADSPLVAGGSALPADFPLALLILRLPWRLGRRILARSTLCLFLCALIAPLIARPGAADALQAFLADALWSPDEFHAPGAASSSFEPATGRSLRLALRASELRLTALSIHRPRCVWDLTLKELHAFATAAAEREGREFTSRKDLEEEK